VALGEVDPIFLEDENVPALGSRRTGTKSPTCTGGRQWGRGSRGARIVLFGNFQHSAIHDLVADSVALGLLDCARFDNIMND
jgi:hypothetical protein